MSKFLVKYRYLVLGVTLALAAVCGVLMFHVNVNTDLTKYLPDDSPMKAGLDLLTTEFDLSADMAGGDVRVMADSLSATEKVDLKYQLHQLPEVSNVTIQENGTHTLYELSVDKSIDQVALGKEIHASHPKIAAVETAQDGTTAEPTMLLGAMALLLIVLFAMCASWLEPVLFLASTGIAVLLNIGTNALLPSVSVTTNSLVAILQLVLSMDYSIVLINRFRQERQQSENSQVAMHRAIRRAAGTIVSSALTTIVGLMMLVFMKLKIGADLGIVLSKGVLFSLICTFTVLPTLILLFEKGIERSHKRTPRFPTDRLARFSQRFRIPLTILFVVLLVGSYILHNQTPISFQYTQASHINQYFPKKNPVVLIYDNADEAAVAALMDSLTACQGVETALSYPSLMQKEYRAHQMVTAIQELSQMGQMAPGADNLMAGAKMDMLSEDVLRLVYYAAHGQQVQRLGFNELANFLLEQADNPQSVIASQMSPDMREKMALLDDFRQLNNEAEEERAIDSSEMEVAAMAEGLDITAETMETDKTESLEKPDRPGSPGSPDSPEHPESPENPIKQVRPITPVSAAAQTAPTNLPDFALLQQPMDYEQMASYLGMDAGQAKMIYRLAKKNGGTLTPLEFVHFLTHDILKRKALAAMIKAEQREQLLALQASMDSAMVERKTQDVTLHYVERADAGKDVSNVNVDVNVNGLARDKGNDNLNDNVNGLAQDKGNDNVNANVNRLTQDKGNDNVNANVNRLAQDKGNDNVNANVNRLTRDKGNDNLNDNVNRLTRDKGNDNLNDNVNGLAQDKGNDNDNVNANVNRLTRDKGNDNLNDNVNGLTQDKGNDNVNANVNRLAHNSRTQKNNNSATQPLGNSVSQQLSNSASQQLSFSASQQLSNSASQQLSNSATQQLSNSASQELSPSDTLDEADPLELIDKMLNGGERYTAAEMAQNFSAMGEPVGRELMELLYLYYGGSKKYDENWTLSLGGMVNFLGDSLINDLRFAHFITPDMKEGFGKICGTLDEGVGMLRSDKHSIAIVVTGLPGESNETYAFLDKYKQLCDKSLSHGYYSVGESVMLAEMKAGFQREMTLVTLLTIAAIFLIVFFTFRSLLVALILVATVMTGVFVDVSVSAIGGGSLLYLAYLIVQSILMGAAIDYGILFANYYREKRTTLDIGASLREAYRGTVNTILTSGLILILVPGAMAVLVEDPTISSIVSAISIGAMATVTLVLLVLPGMLAAIEGKIKN